MSIQLGCPHQTAESQALRAWGGKGGRLGDAPGDYLQNGHGGHPADSNQRCQQPGVHPDPDGGQGEPRSHGVECSQV